MNKIVLGFVGVCALLSTAANAASITVGGQLGPNTNLNCGTGDHSTLLSSSVAEYTVDGLNGSQAYQPCPGSGPDAAYHNYGVVQSTTILLPGFGSITLGTTPANGDGADVVIGSLSGRTGDPWADNTPYFVVPGVNGNTSGSSLTFGLTGLNTQANYFGLYWGSMDTYNNISFTLSDSSTFTYSGSAIAAALAALPNGNQFSSTSNVFVDFFANGATFNSVSLSGTGIAFEVDNIAFGSVPSPGALALLGLGLIGLGGLRRKASRA